MRIDLGPEVERFREEVREWIEANRVEDLGPADERSTFLGPGNAAQQEWIKRLRGAGWLCISWPEDYGGRGLSAVELAVLNEEFARSGVPRVQMGMGETLVGPSIIVHGSEEQKKHFLPRIIAGEDRYCQGFSEPNSGSDLAGLQTKGVVEGDEIVVTGQKIWTSGANFANMIFTLCRTDPAAEKHAGISYVLVPMENNNVEVRPIRQMSERAGFFEVFLDGARAPLFNVISGIGGGWKVAMTTLGNERGAGATIQHLRFQREFWALVELMRKLGKTEDPKVRQQLAWSFTHVELMRMAGLRTLATLAAKKEPGPEASINKLFWSEYHKRLGETVMNLLGPAGAARDKEEGLSVERWWGTFLSSRAETIYAGTSEIQRRIIGERALGLPKEPSSEKDK